MSNRRLELHEKLCTILGSRNVYYQPPETVKMKYPAIVYGLSGILKKYANDRVYNSKRQYSVIIIDKNPDSDIVDRMEQQILCSFDRHYEADNLNHDVFTVFY